MSTCIHCGSTKPGWLILKNENIYVDTNGKNIGETIQTCSYICTRRCEDKFPPKYGRLILNKHDFEYNLIPIVPKQKNKFEVLSYEEIQNMSEIERNNYYTQKENELIIDSDLVKIYDEIENEEKNTYDIEQDLLINSGEEEFYSDDY